MKLIARYLKGNSHFGIALPPKHDQNLGSKQMPIFQAIKCKNTQNLIQLLPSQDQTGILPMLTVQYHGFQN